jgi:hypothetical protein
MDFALSQKLRIKFNLIAFACSFVPSTAQRRSVCVNEVNILRENIENTLDNKAEHALVAYCLGFLVATC